MIQAYDKVYLEKARTNLGRMLDFAVYELKHELTGFFELFITSGVAERFGDGDYSLIAGMSGVELAYTVLESSGLPARRVKARYTQDRSEEYWTGWALAYYQWETGATFSEIDRCIPINVVRDLYSPYHEMDIRQFCDRMNELYRSAKPETNLKLLRRQAGLSQSQLAELSGIPIRMLQQYEQRQKNINKAQAEYLVRLSRTLCCKVEQLLEKIE